MAQPHKVKENSRLGTFAQLLKEKDSFGEGFAMKLDGRNSQLYTYCGLLSSIFLGIIVVLYGYLKTDVLINKKDVSLISSVHQFFYSDEDIFSHKNGLNIAVALTAYDEDTEWILDPKYGELVF